VKRPRPRPRQVVPTYGLMRVLMASATEPMPLAKRTHQLTRMWEGLAALERAPAPTTDDWRLCSDAVSLMETLVRTQGVAQDASGLLDDAIAALAGAGRRHRGGMALRLDAPGIQAVRAVLEDYAELLEQLPEQTVIEAHRLTERRIREILAGRRLPHDVEVVSL
jgi:hypothetical protein